MSRKLIIPIAAYLVITLVLPLANGAARRGDFAHHALYVLGGVAFIAGIAIAAGALVEVIRSFVTGRSKP